MGSVAWVVLGSAIAASGFVLGLCVCLRRKRAAPLCIRVQDVATRMTSHSSGDYCVRIKTDLINQSARSISIHKIEIQTLTETGHTLTPKEICGDRAKTLSKRAHPPDILMRLPISVENGATVDYVFDAFFGPHLNRFWNGGKLRMLVESPEGLCAVAETALPPPH